MEFRAPSLDSDGHLPIRTLRVGWILLVLGASLYIGTLLVAIVPPLLSGSATGDSALLVSPLSVLVTFLIGISAFWFSIGLSTALREGHWFAAFIGAGSLISGVVWLVVSSFLVVRVPTDGGATALVTPYPQAALYPAGWGLAVLVFIPIGVLVKRSPTMALKNRNRRLTPREPPIGALGTRISSDQEDPAD